MNYTLDNIPDSGKYPVVYMDICLHEQILGRIRIKLFRDVFPEGVENFVKIASGKTSRVEEKGLLRKYYKETVRTYQGCKFFEYKYNNYAISGDIYNNNGSDAGTIYSDNSIPACFGSSYYPHDSKGMVSLIPFIDNNGNKNYDSTFMITLDDRKLTNELADLDKDQIVIGQVIEGMHVIDKMNELIIPFAGRKYPEFVIGKCGVQAIINPIKRPINRCQ